MWLVRRQQICCFSFLSITKDYWKRGRPLKLIRDLMIDKVKKKWMDNILEMMKKELEMKDMIV